MKLVPALFALVAFPVLAGTNVPPGQGGTVCQGSTCGGDGGSGITPQVTVNASGKATARSSARSSARSTAHSSANSASFSNAAGGSASIVTNTKIPDNTPDLAVGVPPATSPCRIAVGAGGSGPGLGVMLGFSTLDDGCDAREDARTLWAVGLQGAAYARLCQKPEMARAMGALCQKEEQAPAPVSSIDFVH